MAIRVRRGRRARRRCSPELQWAPFKKSDNNQLLPIRQMEVNRADHEDQGDEKVAADREDAKLADLQKQFGELDKQLASLKK